MKIFFKKQISNKIRYSKSKTNVKYGSSALALLSLTACGGGGGGDSTTAAPAPAPSPDVNINFTESPTNVFIATNDANSTLSQSSNQNGLTVIGKGGNDIITTGSGNDLIRAGSGADNINAGAGNDAIILVGTTTVGQYTLNDITNAGSGYDLSPLITLDNLNGRTVSEASSGEIINGGSGTNLLFIYGEVDLTGVTLSNVTVLEIHSNVTLTAEQIAQFTKINGDGESVINIEIPSGGSDTYILDLSTLDIEDISNIHIDGDLTIKVSKASDLDGVDNITSTNTSYITLQLDNNGNAGTISLSDISETLKQVNEIAINEQLTLNIDDADAIEDMGINELSGKGTLISDGSSEVSDAIKNIILPDNVNIQNYNDPTYFTRVSGEIIINDSDVEYSVSESLLRENGEYFIFWLEENSIGEFSIKGQKYDENHRTSGSKFNVDASSASDGTDGLKAINLSNGNIVVSWDSQAQIFNPSGVKVGARILADDASATLHTTVSSLNDGGFIYFWNDGNHIYAQKYNSSGAEVGNSFRVSDVPLPETHTFASTTLNNGTVVVSWYHDSDNENDQYYKTMFYKGIRTDGSTFSGSVSDSNVWITFNHDDFSSNIDALDDGGFAISFYSDETGNGGTTRDRSVKIQKFDSNGNKDGTEFDTNLVWDSGLKALSNGGFIINAHEPVGQDRAYLIDSDNNIIFQHTSIGSNTSLLPLEDGAYIVISEVGNELRQSIHNFDGTSKGILPTEPIVLEIMVQENADANLIWEEIGFKDFENDEVTALRVSIVENFRSNDDELFLKLGTLDGKVNVDYNANIGVLSLTASAGNTLDNDDFSYMINRLFYRNNSDNPTALMRKIEVEVSDGNSWSKPITIKIDITPFDDIAKFNAPSLEVTEGESVILMKENFDLIDPDGNPLNYYFGVWDIEYGSIQIDGNVVTNFYWQDVLDGKVSFVHDGSNNSPELVIRKYGQITGHDSENGSFDITFTNKNDAPDFSVQASELFAYGIGTANATAIATDGEGDLFTFSIQSQGNKGSVVIDEDTGEYIYTVSDNSLGQDVFQIKATDTNGASSFQSVTVYISPDVADQIGGDIRDVFNGTVADETLIGLGGGDDLYGEGGKDVLFGGSGNDDLEGGDGDDLLYGGSGEDRIIGDDGNDLLYGGSEDDSLDGGEGIDILYGEAGNDLFIFDQLDQFVGGEGYDTLSTFEENINLANINGSGIEEILASPDTNMTSISLTYSDVVRLTDDDNLLVITDRTRDAIISVNEDWIDKGAVEMDTYFGASTRLIKYDYNDATILIGETLTLDIS